MARTFRTLPFWARKLGLKEYERDHKPISPKCGPSTVYPRGYNTFDDDHGLYGPSGNRYHKKMASSCRRIIDRRETRAQLKED